MTPDGTDTLRKYIEYFVIHVLQSDQYLFGANRNHSHGPLCGARPADRNLTPPEGFPWVAFITPSIHMVHMGKTLYMPTRRLSLRLLLLRVVDTIPVPKVLRARGYFSGPA